MALGFRYFVSYGVGLESMSFFSSPPAVILQKEVRNIFNEMRPHEVLQDCQAYTPASMIFVHFCHGDSAHLVFWIFWKARIEDNKDIPL